LLSGDKNHVSGKKIGYQVCSDFNVAIDVIYDTIIDGVQRREHIEIDFPILFNNQHAKIVHDDKDEAIELKICDDIINYVDTMYI
jgi:hypothetical protein